MADKMIEANKPIRDSAVLYSRILEFVGSIDNMHPVPAYIVAQRPDIAELTNVDRVSITLADMFKRGRIGRSPYKDQTSPTTRWAYHGLNSARPVKPVQIVKQATQPAKVPAGAKAPQIDLFYHKDGRVSLKLGALTITIGVEN